MNIIKPPNLIPLALNKTLFLAGSIEMGLAQNWQAEIESLLSDTDWTLLNPRRDDWNSSWTQTKDHPQFRQQVEWELSALEQAEKVIFYFEPGTKSPVSLMELGLAAANPQKVLVVCPEGFWRKGNVDIVCERFGIAQASSLEEAITLLEK